MVSFSLSHTPALQNAQWNNLKGKKNAFAMQCNADTHAMLYASP
jgi:hypothetical protein